MIQTDPRRALRIAEAWVDATAGSDALALVGLARCQFELADLGPARTTAIAASIAAVEADERTQFEVGMSVSAILAEAGDVDGALREIDRLLAGELGRRSGRLATQRAYVLHHAGRLADALDQADRAEPMLRQDQDQLGLTRLLVNRGLIQLQRGNTVAALSDFESGRRLAEEGGQEVVVAGVWANLGVLQARVGRISDAVACFEEASRRYAAAGSPSRMVAIMEVDQAEVLCHNGLPADAVAAATRAVERVARSGNQVVLGDALLILAKAHLIEGSYRSATIAVQRARERFEATGRDELVHQADSVACLARLASARRPAELMLAVEEARLLSAALARGGWGRLADELRLGALQAAYRGGSTSVMVEFATELRLGAFSGQRHEALMGWYAEAVARSLDGDPRGALEASTAGLDLLDVIVAEAPTLEQRSAAMRMGAELSQLAIEFAVELGDADTVLAAAEGTRARALHDELHEQRQHRPLTEDGAAQLRRELAVRLGERALIEWVVARGVVWAVVFDASGSRLVRVADANDVVRAADRVLVWLDLAATEPDESSERAMRSAALLDQLLMAPLHLPPDNGVVIVPVGLLHGIPWSGLPSFAGRPMTLAPNAQLWLEADRRAAGSVRTIGLVAGPDVASVSIERKAVGRWFPDAAIAAGFGATASTVKSMFGGYDLVHVAAHGRFRSDRPLLSTLRLHDGESSLSDTVPERLVARLVILSSCEGGAQGTADGSEVLGLSSVMLARGAASVLAPLTVVRDLECADFVADVYAELAAGESLACAAANVRGRWLQEDDLSRWAVASSFTCFGSGASSVAG